MSFQNAKDCTNVKRKNDYRNISADPVIKESEAERIRIYSEVDIDYAVFRKTDQEKLRLKHEKAAVKSGIKRRRIRPNKAERYRLCLAKQENK